MNNMKEQTIQKLSYSKSQITQLICSESFLYIENHVSPTTLKYSILFGIYVCYMASYSGNEKNLSPPQRIKTLFSSHPACSTLTELP
jgi:hypothetical protein